MKSFEIYEQFQDTMANMTNDLTLNEALDLILGECTAKPVTETSLTKAMGAVVAADHHCLTPYPPYDQSLYDGFALASTPVSSSTEGDKYHQIGEIAAGDVESRLLSHGKAYRIMTGAMVPEGTRCVVPQELCRVEGDSVVVHHFDIIDGLNIQQRGAWRKKGELVAQQGEIISAQLAARLADSGVDCCRIHDKPKVSFICTGSELVASNSKNQTGKKVSSNRFLLNGLIRSFGADAQDCGIITDDPHLLSGSLLRIAEEKPDVIISTGGMGPGKYDLLLESFLAAGGTARFTSLLLRPGKSILFGRLGESLYFGLPGPPPAVLALFHGLIAPLILHLQGYSAWNTKEKLAFLCEDISNGGNSGKGAGSVEHLREGFYHEEDGKIYVRPVKKKELANCLIRLTGSVVNHQKEDIVLLLELQPPPHIHKGELSHLDIS